MNYYFLIPNIVVSILLIAWMFDLTIDNPVFVIPVSLFFLQIFIVYIMIGRLYPIQEVVLKDDINNYTLLTNEDYRVVLKGVEKIVDFDKARDVRIVPTSLVITTQYNFYGGVISTKYSLE